MDWSRWPVINKFFANPPETRMLHAADPGQDGASHRYQFVGGQRGTLNLRNDGTLVGRAVDSDGNSYGNPATGRYNRGGVPESARGLIGSSGEAKNRGPAGDVYAEVHLESNTFPKGGPLVVGQTYYATFSGSMGRWQESYHIAAEEQVEHPQGRGMITALRIVNNHMGMETEILYSPQLKQQIIGSVA